jgi:hypothetical protein
MRASKVSDKHPNHIRRVYARVVLRPLAEQEEILEAGRSHMSRARYAEWLAAIRSPDDLDLLVSLTAEDRTGRRIDGMGASA